MNKFRTILFFSLVFASLSMQGRPKSDVADGDAGTPIGILAEPGSPVINYTPLSSPNCTYIGMTLSGVQITDETGIPLSGGTVPRIYYRKNAGAWFSRPGTNTAGTALNSTWSFTIVESDLGGVSGGDAVNYYIIAQDILATPNVGASPSAGFNATSVVNVVTHPTNPNSYSLRYILNGVYPVGIGGTFSTLTIALAAYNNACTLAGPVVFELIDNTYPSESFPLTILNHADAGNLRRLTIRPSASATPIITGATLNPIINLNGAKYITIDGRQAGSGTPKSLTLSNTGTGITIQFINDAQNDSLKNCIVKGRRASSFSGMIVFGTANASGTGNDNNTVDNNDITDATSQSTNAIYSSGTASKENNNVSIINNNISNYFNATTRSVGLNVFANSTAWTISGNRFFQTATRVYTFASDHYGMWINSGSGYTISNNIIGFENMSGTGTTKIIGNPVNLPGFPASYTADIGISIRYIGIVCIFTTGGASSAIDGNTIGGIAMYTSSPGFPTYGILCGIYIENGNATIGTNIGNTIGSIAGSGSIYAACTEDSSKIVGIRAGSTGSIRNNRIGGIDASEPRIGFSRHNGNQHRRFW
ncbi:MAG: hypothetical protein WKI04_14745 [Ferruginibacter sp.]